MGTVFRPKSALSSNVFLVYGRNAEAHQRVAELLRQFGLSVLDWEGAVRLTGNASPHAREVLDAAMRNVGAVVVLMTGDEEARLRPELCRLDEMDIEGVLRPQARPNVLFEAGLAFGLFPDRTIVVQLGRLRAISDIAGLQYVPLDESPESRRALANRLRTARCAVREMAGEPVALPSSEDGLPSAGNAGAGVLSIYRRLRGAFGLPGFGGSLEVADTAEVGETLTLFLDLPPQAEEYRLFHWTPGAATPRLIGSGARSAVPISVPVTIPSPAGIHLFDLETRASAAAGFRLMSRQRCAIAEA
jgi:hypothetical protein